MQIDWEFHNRRTATLRSGRRFHPVARRIVELKSRHQMELHN